MEYLITYGWALLLIAIVASLLYLYIVVPRVIVPASCSFASGVYCNDLILGSNSTTHASVLGIFITNTQPYPIYNPVLYVSLNGVNVTPVACKPNYVLAGGSILCTIPLSQKTSFGQFVIGNLYINASYCGLANSTSPSSCASAPRQIYSGKFNAHVAPLVSTTSSIELTAANTTNPGNPANNARDPLHATVKLLGYPLSGATVNFTATFANGTDAVPPYTLASQYATTGATGGAVDYIWGTKVGNVKVTAQYANLNTSVNITFTPVTKITFKVPSAGALMGSSGSVLATIDGTGYTYSQLQNKTFLWGCGSSHTYSFPAVPYNVSGSRLVFQYGIINGITSTASSGSMTVDCALSDQNESADYATQYEFTSSVHPSTGGTVSPVNTWYGAYSQVGISEAPNTNYVFKNWTGTGAGSYSGQSPSATVLMEGPVNETLNYYAPIGITLESSSMTGTTGTVVTVGGTQYTYAQLPHLITTSYGTPITYAYTTNVSAGAGTQYGLPVVSGCATSVSGSFVAQQNCTLTGQYTLQYTLATSVSPTSGGTLTPAAGTYWEDAGSTNTITESPNSAQNYVFNTWAGTGTGSYSGTLASASVTMDSPITEVAEYHSPLIITFEPSMAGASGPVLVVNNVQYNASQMPVSVGVKYGETVTYAYNTSPIPGGTGTRYVITGASGCGASGTSSSFTASSNCTVTATYTTQYLLTMAAAPSNGGTASPAAGSYWENAGTNVAISQTPNTNYVFHQWTGSGTGSYTGTTSASSVTMDSAITETAYYYTPIVVKFYATGLIGTPSGTVLTANNTNYAYGSPVATIGVPYDSAVSYSYASNVSGGTGIQSVYSSISGCGTSAQSGSFTVTANCSVTATYTGQYQLTMAVSPSGSGTTSPAAGTHWEASGANIAISATPSTNYVFKNWTSSSGTGSYAGTSNPSSVTMDGPISETANYYPPVGITFTATGLIGTPSGTVVTVGSTQYTYAQLPAKIVTSYGTGITYSYTSNVSGGTGIQSIYGSISGCGTSAQSGTVTATANCTATAAYTGQYQLTMAVSPSGSGTTSPSIGTHWYASGTNIAIGETPSTNYVFKNWTSSVSGSGYTGTSSSTTIVMPSTPLTETANFYSPVTISFTVPSNGELTVNGQVYTSSGSILVPYDSTVTYTWDGPISGGTGVQYIVNPSSVSGCGVTSTSGSFTATSNCTLTASYITQYYLTMATTSGGSASPSSGWYNAGSGVTISESPASGYVFVDWTCSGTGCYSGTATSIGITINNPITETANFETAIGCTGGIFCPGPGIASTTNWEAEAALGPSSTQLPAFSANPYQYVQNNTYSTQQTGTWGTSFQSIYYSGQSIVLPVSWSGGTAPYTANLYSGSSSSCSSDTTLVSSQTGISGTSTTFTESPSATTYYCVEIIDTNGQAFYTSTAEIALTDLSYAYATSGTAYIGKSTFGQTISTFPSVTSDLQTSSVSCGSPYDSELAMTNTSITLPAQETVVAYLNTDDAMEVYYKPAGSSSWSNFANGAAWHGQGATQYGPYSVTLGAGTYDILADQINDCGGGQDSFILAAYSVGSSTAGTLPTGTYVSSTTTYQVSSTTTYLVSSTTTYLVSSSSTTSVSINGCVVGGGTECGASNCPSGYSCVGSGKYVVTVSGQAYCLTSGGGIQLGTCESTSQSGGTTSTKATTSTKGTTSAVGGGSVYGSEPVLMMNGSYIPAIDVKVGDVLAGYDFITGKVMPATVLYITTTKVNNEYIINGNLYVDADEVLLLNGAWQRAYTAKVGDTLFDPQTGKYIAVTSVQRQNVSNGTVYDFYTAPQNNFIGSGYLIDVKINSVSATSSVLMANGTYAPITALKTGESVYGYNATTHQPTTGTVTAVGSRLATTEYVINGVLQVDPEAYLLVNGVRTSVQDLKVGDTVQLGNGATVRVGSIRLLHGIFLVYDIGTTSGSYVVNGYVIE